jgi:DNA primase
MRFDEQFLETVRDSVSIVELIGSYVNLKKRGKDWAALCPFHSEKTPSFWVSESKRIFKCFGCGAGGDVFKFLTLMENLNFGEAVTRLAERQGRREQDGAAPDNATGLGFLRELPGES